MAQAAAMFVGLWLAFGALAAPVAETPLLAGGGGAAAVVLLAWRFGLFRGGDGASVRALGEGALACLRAPHVLRRTLETLRIVLAGDVQLRPALVRMRARASERAQETFANILSAEPGLVAVDVSDAGCLLHVLDEDKADAAQLRSLEGQCARVHGDMSSDGKGVS